MKHLYKLMYDSIEIIIPYYENGNCRRINDQLNISHSHAMSFKKKGKWLQSPCVKQMFRSSKDWCQTDLNESVPEIFELSVKKKKKRKSSDVVSSSPEFLNILSLTLKILHDFVLSNLQYALWNSLNPLLLNVTFRRIQDCVAQSCMKWWDYLLNY